ncbi:hypothetical protein QJQ45_004825 [Haematococcus lacustris]|nr:hypothetical protein QJQ45_004825 [Haematococcus lacustris]
MLAVRVFMVAVMLASASAQSEILTLHNAYRERHQVPPLTSSAALTSAAQSWANSLAVSCTFEIDLSTEQGENLASGHRSWAEVASDCAMKGKKRKGSAEPKQPTPKQPKPKPKGKPDTVGWVGPVSPKGKALKDRVEEWATSRFQFVKCLLEGFNRVGCFSRSRSRSRVGSSASENPRHTGHNMPKNKLVEHFRLRVGIHHKQRKLASLGVLVQVPSACTSTTHILDPLAAQRVQDWAAEYATPSKASFTDPINLAITAKLVELDKTVLAGDGNTIGALAKQMAVNTREMFANQ